LQRHEKENQVVKNLYVGNLSYNTSQAALSELFEEYGEVTSVNIITDRATGRSKGFGFIEMADDDAAAEAMSELNGRMVDGRPITVQEARPRQPRSDRSGGREGRSPYR
jgi:RNA recognition motif-containing protein